MCLSSYRSSAQVRPGPGDCRAASGVSASQKRQFSDTRRCLRCARGGCIRSPAAGRQRSQDGSEINCHAPRTQGSRRGHLQRPGRGDRQHRSGARRHGGRSATPSAAARTPRGSGPCPSPRPHRSGDRRHPGSADGNGQVPSALRSSQAACGAPARGGVSLPTGQMVGQRGPWESRGPLFGGSRSSSVSARRARTVPRIE